MEIKNKAFFLGLVIFYSSAWGQTLPRQQGDSVKNVRHEFSIQQAVEYARQKNTLVKAALLDIKLQEQVNKTFTANAYPHVSANLGTTYNPNVATQILPNFISPATYQVLINEGVKDGNGNAIQMPDNFGYVSAQFGTKFNATIGISLTQILFDGQIFVGLRARDAVLKLYQKTAEVTEENIKANIYKLYYQLAVSKTAVDILDATISLLEKNRNDTRILYENGFKEKLDIDKATVQLANLQTEKRKVSNTISNGYYGLKLLLGMPITDDLILTDKITDDQIKEGLLETGGYSYEDRKEYQQILVAKQLNEYNVQRYRLSQLPTLTLIGTYAKNAQRDKWNFFGNGDWFTLSNVGVNLSIPIFNGFYSQSKLQEARLQVQKINTQLDGLRLSIDNEVETAKNNYRSAVAAMDFQKKNMELAEKIYQQTKKKYELGTGQLIEIFAAQTDMKAAQSNYITTLYDAIIAKVDYLKAAGRL